MKLIHLSDLHIGKRFNEYSMIEDQKYILKRILNIIDDEKPEAVIIAGDIYDKSIPSVEAVELLDDFMVSLSKRDLKVLTISGNHDSPERLAFGNRLMNECGIYISSVYNGETQSVSFEDEFGTVDVYLLPFVKPANVRRFFPDAEIANYTDALKVAIEAMNINKDRRNVLVAHQFVTGATRSDSEEISVGGTDNVDASVFNDFDYVALGHIHGPQNVSDKRIRYCGTPLKYSFSEKKDKSVSVVELGAKGELTVREVALKPVRDMVEIRGTYAELSARSFYEGTTLRDDYVHVTLTDEDDIPNAMSKLKVIYNNLMKIDYDNTRTRSRTEIGAVSDIENKSPYDLFEELFEKQNGVKPTEVQENFVKGLLEKIMEGER